MKKILDVRCVPFVTSQQGYASVRYMHKVSANCAALDLGRYKKTSLVSVIHKEPEVIAIAGQAGGCT